MVYLPHWPIPSTLGNRKIAYETVFERMEIVLKKLGNPQKKLPPIIHIAGTNGKGSATALTAKIFELSGYKTHIYTSPHLHDCNERIVLNGEKISDNFLFEIMEETRIAAGEMPLTFMESFTIGAILAFSKIPADIAVIECGMGGRIDATNILENKISTLIMPISFDHTEYLGNSIKRIALEKAMIMRPQVPLIVSAQALEAKEIIKILSDDQKIKSYFYDEDFAIRIDEDNGKWDLDFAGEIIENLPQPALAGNHQYINFSTAIAGILALKDYKFEIEKIKQAIREVKWPSRLEKVQNNLNKILKNPQSEIIIDGAHNPAGALALANWIKENNDKKTFVIVGFSKNKCKKEFLEKLKEQEIIAVKVDGEPYPERAEVIIEIGKEINLKIHAAEDLVEAIDYVAKKMTNKKCRIVICGSLHLARDMKKFGN